MTPTAFEAATAVAESAPGRWTAPCDPEWFGPIAPHGGYVAAIIVNAFTAAVGDPTRSPRSVTIHYLRPPKPGTLELEVTVERTGRSLTSMSARVSQGDTLYALALAAYSVPFASGTEYAPEPPDVRRADEIERIVVPAPMPISTKFDMRRAIGGGPFEGADDATTGGWMSLVDPPTTDAAVLALFADAWMPTLFMRAETFAPVPTVDLTIHFRVSDPAAHVAPGEPVLGVFTSRASADGFFDEEGELWSAGGVLLAQSRQLALAIPL